MAERSNSTVLAPLGAFRALGWFFENSKDIFLAAEHEVVKRTNPVWQRLTGFATAATENTSLWDYVDAEDRPALQSRCRALTLGDRFECELRLRTKAGGTLWARGDFVGGEGDWVLAILRDITAERALRESEGRFRGLVNATSDVVYRMSPDWREMRQLDGRGFIADTSEPNPNWMEAYVPLEDQPLVLAAIEEAVREGTVFQLEHRVRQIDGSTGWTFSRAVPLRNDEGEIIEWFGAASDVTERRRAEAHLRLVINELNHRVKNNLAMIDALAIQTFRTAEDLRHAEGSLSARIAALAHANDLLTGDEAVAPSIRHIVDQAVRPHCGDDARWSLGGPDLSLSPHRAHSLSLAMHELATNAVKHGAWSTAEGAVDVSWSAAESRLGPRLRLEWRERGGPRVEPPKRRGFGTRLIERGLARELDGAVQLHFEPTGLVCLIDASLAA